MRYSRPHERGGPGYKPQGWAVIGLWQMTPIVDWGACWYDIYPSNWCFF